MCLHSISLLLCSLRLRRFRFHLCLPCVVVLFSFVCLCFLRLVFSSILLCLLLALPKAKRFELDRARRQMVFFLENIEFSKNFEKREIRFKYKKSNHFLMHTFIYWIFVFLKCVQSSKLEAFWKWNLGPLLMVRRWGCEALSSRFFHLFCFFSKQKIEVFIIFESWKVDVL